MISSLIGLPEREAHDKELMVALGSCSLTREWTTNQEATAQA
jgi:hypothetical protein